MHSIRILIAVIVLMTTACSNWEPASCSDGKLCPPGTKCAADQDVCIATCGDGIIDEQEGETWAVEVGGRHDELAAQALMVSLLVVLRDLLAYRGT